MNKATYDFSNRVALVTGGSRGIGKAIALQLAEFGADVAINFRNNADAASEVINAIEQLGRNAIAIKANVADPDEVTTMVNQVVERLGPIDFLVNNAGVFDVVPHTETSLELWNRTMSINVTGTYLCSWAVKDSMVERGFGRIVNLASIAGLEPKPYAIAYATSKSAIIGFTRSLGVALAEDGVRVNAIAPGLIKTDILDTADPELLEQLIELTPVKRIGSVDDITPIAMFMLSDHSDFMTGQTIVASGGRVTIP